MILTHADRMRKRVAQKYLYRSGWLAGVAGRSWRWLAGVRFPAGWLARGLFTGWRPAGWRAGGSLAGWCWHAWRALAWRPGPYPANRADANDYGQAGGHAIRRGVGRVPSAVFTPRTQRNFRDPYRLVLLCANATYRRGAPPPAHLLLR